MPWNTTYYQKYPFCEGKFRCVSAFMTQCNYYCYAALSHKHWRSHHIHPLGSYSYLAWYLRISISLTIKCPRKKRNIGKLEYKIFFCGMKYLMTAPPGQVQKIIHNNFVSLCFVTDRMTRLKCVNISRKQIKGR